MKAKSTVIGTSATATREPKGPWVLRVRLVRLVLKVRRVQPVLKVRQVQRVPQARLGPQALKVLKVQRELAVVSTSPAAGGDERGRLLTMAA